MKRGLSLALFLLVAACAGQRSYDDGMSLLDAGRYEEGLAKIEEASRLEPENRQYRQAYFRQRDIALQRYLALAESARQQGEWVTAEALYKRMLDLSPDNSRAKAGLVGMRGERRLREKLAEAEALLKKGDETAALAVARGVLSENASSREGQLLVRRIEERTLRASNVAPQLAAALRKPVTLEFRDAGLRQVFELLSRSTGLNFIFDRDVRQDQRTTVFVRNSSVEDVLRFVLVTNQLERKILSENTVLIYPNTPAKLRDYQELIVKSFYLANADVKTTANMIKTLVKTKDLHIDEKLNLLVMRDTPDAVRMAERLVANQDLAEPEVMLEVEVMEVGRNSLYNMGVQFPDQVSLSLIGAAGTAGTVTLPEWLNRSAGLAQLTFTNPLLAVNFRNTLGRTNLLANPRIRVKNREKAKVHIGDKVPVITTTTTATGFVAESVTYLDVGLKLEVEPLVYLEDDVGIKIGLEVSNIVNQIKSASGTLTYQVGTRNTTTSLRLRDGETQVLAGLINDEDRKNVTQVPGLGDVPILGRLFGNHLDTVNKTEIVLLITPRVVRNLNRPEARFEEFPSGTEASAGAPPLFLRSSVVSSPASAASAGAPAAVPGAASVPANIQLRVPTGVTAGGEITVQVALDAETPVRNGLLDFAFDPARLKFLRADPGALLASADSAAGFRTSAPESLGRLSLSFTSKRDVKGSGNIATLTFQVAGQGTTPPSLRVEAMSFVGATGQVVATQLPPPLGLPFPR